MITCVYLYYCTDDSVQSDYMVGEKNQVHPSNGYFLSYCDVFNGGSWNVNICKVAGIYIFFCDSMCFNILMSISFYYMFGIYEYFTSK